MGSHVGSTVEIGGDGVAVQRYGGGPPAPGWWVRQAFRGHEGGPEHGPYDSLAEAERAHLAQRMRARLLRYDEVASPHAAGLRIPFPMRYLQGRHPDIYTPFVCVGSDGLWLARTVRIDSFVKLEAGGGLLLGEHVHVASFCHLGIGGGLTILEDGSSFGSGSRVVSGSNTYGPGHGCSAIDPAARVTRSFAHVKRNATLYAGATVLPGVTVGEGAVLAAGAVATRDVPDYELWAGVPARRVKFLTRPAGTEVRA